MKQIKLEGMPTVCLVEDLAAESQSGEKRYCLPAGWTRCFPGEGASYVWHPETGKITGFATQNPYQIIVSGGRITRSWLPLDNAQESDALLFDMVLSYPNLAAAERGYQLALDEEYADTADIMEEFI